jgi:signal transduction histidine kinase
MASNPEKVILLLDDEDEVPALVRREFGEEMQVLHFRSASSFIEHVRSDSFKERGSIALIDIVLGRDYEAGFETAHYLSENEIYIPIVFLSESKLTSHITRSAEAGSHAYVVKERLRRDPSELRTAFAQAEGAWLRQEEERIDKLIQWGNRAVVLAGALSHEIRALIDPMLNTALALRNTATIAPTMDADIVIRAVDGILSDLDRARSLLNTAFKFISGNSDVLSRSEIDIAALVAEIVDRHASEHPPVRFQGSGAHLVHADRTRITQMVFNLINNAQKYAPDGQAIDVSVTIDDRFVNVCVRDYGSTRLSAREVRRIWAPLVRGDNAAGTEGGGYGLAIVKQFALMHGGSVYHRYPDDNAPGNSFGFRLPRSFFV